VVLAPDILTDAPRCIEWLWADRGAGLQRLEVDLEPESVEFYDHTADEWYRGPELTRKQSIAGPYVDYICTHKYTYTLSVPLAAMGCSPASPEPTSSPSRWSAPSFPPSCGSREWLSSRAATAGSSLRTRRDSVPAPYLGARRRSEI
jgi:hypothetical protein